MSDTTPGSNDTSGYADEVREHKFDGIEEFDNRLPNWWLWTFYGACIFSLFYWVHFHVLGTGDLPREAFRQELQAWREKQPEIEITPEMLAELQNDPAAMEAAAAEWSKPGQCVSCHGEDGAAMLNGSPMIGPNLTDDAWLHGSQPMDIYKVIRDGVPAKGMQSWEPILGKEKVAQLAAYVLKEMKGADIEGGKAPQGAPEK